MNAALDKEAFVAISSTAPGSFLEHCLIVDQMHKPSSPQYVGKSLLSKASGRVVAVVDRTAKIDSAVKEIFASRMQYGGQSHYAVDQVFVNEFVADEFLAVMRKEFSIRAEAIDQTVNNGHARLTPAKRHIKLVADDCAVVGSQGNAVAALVKLR